MRRLLLISTVLVGLQSAPVQAQDACAPYLPPAPEVLAAMPPEEYRAAMLEGAKHQVCLWGTKEPSRDRYHPPGSEVFWAELKKVVETNQRLIQSRQTVPTPARFAARFQSNPEFRARWMDVIMYVQLTEAIYWEDSCPTRKPGGYCVHGTALTMIEEQGKDGRAEAARLTATRVLPYDPWFVLGKVTVEVDGTHDLERSELRADRMLAKDAYDRAKATLSDREAGFAAAQKRHGERKTEIYALTEELAAEIAEIEGEAIDDPEAEARARERRDLDARIGRLYDRRAEIDRALDSLHSDYPADDAFAQRHIGALNSELGDIDRREAALTERMEALPEAQRDPDTQRRLDGLKARHRAAKDAADSAMRIEDDILRRAQSDLREARNVLDEADEAVMDLEDRIARHRATKTARVISIHTDDAEIRLAGEETPDLLATLNRQIRQLRDELQPLTERREAARTEMIVAAAEADRLSDALAEAGLHSLLAQAGVEFAFSAYDIFKAAAAGGPAAAALEGGQKALNNILYPPGYTDADKGRLADYMGHAEDPRSSALVTPYTGDNVLKLAGKELAKSLLGMPGKTAQSRLTAKDAYGRYTGLTSALQDYARRNSLSDAKRQVLLDALKDRRKEAADAIEDFTKRSGGRGLGAQGQRLFKDFGTNLLKAAVKEGAKAALAEILEGSAFDDYMYAQADLSRAVLRFRHLGDAYWKTQDRLTLLRATRDTLAEEYRPEEGTLETRNAAFYADPGYSLRLEFEEGVHASDLRARVYLGDLELERQGTLPVWALPAEASTRFTIDTAERLPVRIVFE